MALALCLIATQAAEAKLESVVTAEADLRAELEDVKMKAAHQTPLLQQSAGVTCASPAHAAPVQRCDRCAQP